MQDQGRNSDSAEVRNLKRDAEGRIHSGETALSVLQHEATVLRHHESKHGHFSKDHYRHEMKLLKKALQHDGYLDFSPHAEKQGHLSDKARKILTAHDTKIEKALSPKGKVAAKVDVLPEIDNPFIEQHKVEAPKLPDASKERQLPFSPGTTGLLDNWNEQHKALVHKAQSGVPDTAFFGDSITDGMSLNNSFKNLHGKTANFGIHSDTTENLRYRLEHGELNFKNGKAPKDFVMLIGTNDIDQGKSHEQIARDIMGNAELIAHKFPNSKVLVLGLLPRGGHRDDVTDINKLLHHDLSEQHSPNIHFSDIGRSMLEKNGSMSRDVWQGDFEHPTYDHGYTRLLAAIKKSLDAEH